MTSKPSCAHLGAIKTVKRGLRTTEEADDVKT